LNAANVQFGLGATFRNIDGWYLISEETSDPKFGISCIADDDTPSFIGEGARRVLMFITVNSARNGNVQRPLRDFLVACMHQGVCGGTVAQSHPQSQYNGYVPAEPTQSNPFLPRDF
jgi:hypothetical protein